MAFDYTRAIVSLPKNNTDKVIGVLTGSISVSGASSPATSATGSATRDTGFGDWCLFSGIFSTDGGSTWNDMGSQTPDLSIPGAPVFDTFDCVATCSSTGVFTITCTSFVNLNTGTVGAKTYQYKVILLAKDGQGTLTPLPTDSLPLYHSSRYNYQKISTEGTTSFTVTAGNNGQTSVTHNLGYIPNVRVWQNDAGTIKQIFSQPEVKITSTSVTFYYDGFFDSTNKTFNLIYRIYLDG